MTMQPFRPPGPPVQVAPKSPALAVFLSFLIPGLGSMTSGAGSIGALILVTWIIGWITAAFLIGIPVLTGAWIWGMVHAHGAARRWNADHGVIS